MLAADGMGFLATLHNVLLGTLPSNGSKYTEPLGHCQFAFYLMVHFAFYLTVHFTFHARNT